MTKYAKFEVNSEVMDVLFCIITGHETVKKIQEKLKQPQSTVSTKLMFLRQNKIVEKDKWIFKPNWEVICNKMYGVLKKEFKKYENTVKKIRNKNKIKKLENILQNTEVYFPKSLLMGILKVYSWMFVYGYEKLSLQEIIGTFLSYIPKVKDSQLKKLNKRLCDVKDVLKIIPSKEEVLFSYLTKRLP